MRRTQPSPHTVLVIRFLTTFMRKDADPASGFSTPNSEGESPQDALAPARNEWPETAAMYHDISVDGYAYN